MNQKALNLQAFEIPESTVFMYFPSEEKKKVHNSVEKDARMAEQVDALVSKTSGISRAGSTPAPGTSSLILSKSALKKINFTGIKFSYLNSLWIKCINFISPKKNCLN